MVQVRSLASALQKIRQGCTELYLYHKKIGAEGAKELAAALNRVPFNGMTNIVRG